MNVRRLALVALLIGLISPLGLAQELTVAAAADLEFDMQDVTARFHKETGKTVKLIYGSSGNFFQHIQNGAPFDMFFPPTAPSPKNWKPLDRLSREPITSTQGARSCSGFRRNPEST